MPTAWRIFSRWLRLRRRIWRWQRTATQKPLQAEAPLRAQLFSAEQMERHGKSLAHGHRLHLQPRPDLLLSRLLALSCDETRPPCGCLRAVQGHAIKSAELSQPVLVLPLLGSKRLRDETPWQDVGPGQLMVVPGARRVDMEHRPDRLTGD